MIVSAAVKVCFLPCETVEDEVIYLVRRHRHCKEALDDRGYILGKDYKIVQEGFITDKDEYLDRREAADHAYECGQLVETAEEPRIEVLFSEDLWQKGKL